MEKEMRDDVLELLMNTVPNTDFVNSNHYIDDGLLDSLDIVELIAQLEEKYSFKMNASDIDPDHFENVDTICNLIAMYIR